MQGMLRKIAYEVRPCRGAKANHIYRVPGGEWFTIYEEARRVGRAMDSVRRSVDAGRPTNVPATAYLVNGGEFHGQWMRICDIRRLTGFGGKFIAARCDDRTGLFNYAEPMTSMRRAQASTGRKRIYKPRHKRSDPLAENKAASAFAVLRRVAA
jgi:hypothetical protein